MAKPLNIFKAGRHTAMSGMALDFSAADLKASAAAYNPDLHEAPLVVGHPAVDAPAYGWVKSLAYTDGLQAEPTQVDAAFAELVKAGRFKKISASFYEPNSPSNPVPGVYYLRHVGFLGAQPPAVKGLKAVEFGASEQGIVTFGENDDVTNAGLWRNLREYFISQFGLESADKTIPNFAVQLLENAAQAEAAEAEFEPDPPNFNEPDPQGDTMSSEDKARLAVLEQENKDLKAQQLAFAEAETTRKTAALHDANLAFAEGLIAAGTLLPAQKAVTVACLDALGNQLAGLEFSEGDNKKLLCDGVKALLTALPKQIDFSEFGGGAEAADGSVQFAAPPGEAVDGARLKIHQAALSYQSKHNCDYLTAAKAVGAN